MGGYCKANGDCHCTAPFFASNGHSCELSCTPTSHPTACCRTDTDCQSGGDKSGYCKSPKSTLHTSPGNGQCRCGEGFTGTTSCHKATEDEAHESLMIGGQMESTPAWLTGDIEAPAGEKDMGGWVARVYTPEQQTRLGVDAMGEAPLAAKLKTLQLEPEIDEKEAHWKGSAVLMCVSGSAVLAILILLVMRARGKRDHATELSAVYEQAMGGGSLEQI